MLENQKLAAAVIAVAVIAGAGIFYTTQTADQSDNGEDLETLRIGHVPSPLSTPHYTAIEEGFYREQGFDAEMVQMPGPQIGKALLNERIEVGSSATTPAAYQRANNLSLRLVAERARFTRNGSGGAYLVAAEDSDITSSEDLQGRTICLSTSGGMGELWLAMWAEEHNYTQGEDFQITYLGDETQYQTALASGSVDACYLDASAPTYTMLDENVGVRIIDRMPRGDWVAAFVSVRKDWIEEKPEKLNRFLTAYKKAAEYAREHPEERIEHVAKYTSLSEETLREATLPSVSSNLSIETSDLEQVQSLMAENGMVERDMDMSPLVYNEAIMEVQSEMQ